MTTSEVSWVLTPGVAGMRSQALGLAQAVGLPIVEKRVAVRAPWHWLPGGFLPMPLSAIAQDSDTLSPPWPRLVVACGRQSIGPALAVKRLSGGRTLAAYVQNPEAGRGKFDLVAAMPHDRVRGPNVVSVRTALHDVTQERLEAARNEWRHKLRPDAASLLGVLIGGDSGRYSLTDAVIARLVRVLKAAKDERGMRAAVTSSRRTGEARTAMIADALTRESVGAIWDGIGANPYLGILGLADRLIVTGESISMISEALASGRPVHVLRLEGHGRRHDAFLRGIIEDGLVSPITGDNLDWNFAGQEPIDATAEPASRLRAMLR